MFRFAIRLLVLIGLIVGSVVVLAAPDEPEAVANAGWEEMGVGSASGGGISNDSSAWNRDPALAIGPGGAPVIAWDYDSSGDEEGIYVRRWNGTSWVQMGDGSASGDGINDNDGDSHSPSVAIGSDGTSVVGWTDNSGGNWEIYVRRWNGSAWVEMAGGSASGGGISDSNGESSYPSMAIGSGNAPVVAWADNSDGNWEIYVRRWSDSAWVEMAGGSASGGGISNNHGDSYFPSVAIGPDGAPVVAWMDNSNGNYDIYVRQWNGSAWVEMGGGSALGGGISNSLSGAKYPSLAIGPDGIPIVAWMDYSRGWAVPEIYVRRWNGSAWVEMSNGSASGGGISNTVGGSEYPSLAIGPDNTPVVTWMDNSLHSEDYEIYVRRWNGTTWIEMDSGSASGVGISSHMTSWRPSLAIGSDNVSFITWMGDVPTPGGGTEWEIYVRRYQPCMPSWQNHNSQQSFSSIIPSTSLQTLFLPSVLRERPLYFAGPEEFEPNNNQNEATGLICSGYEYVGLPNDRYDIFLLEATSGLVIVNLTNHLPSGVQLQLHHQTITSHPIAIDVNGADGYRIELPNAPAGRYYVVISTLTPNPNTTTRYQLTPTFNMSR